MLVYYAIKFGLLLAVSSQAQSEQTGKISSIQSTLNATCVTENGENIIGNYRSDFYIWNSSTLKELNKVRTGVSSSRYLDYSSNSGLLVISGGINPIVEVWDIKEKSPKLRTSIAPKAPLVYGVAISPDGKLIAISGRSLQIWNVEQKTKIFEFRNKNSIGRCRFSPDGKSLAMCSSLDGEVTLFSLEKRSLIEKVKLNLGKARWFEFHPNKKFLYIGAEVPGLKSGGISLYDLSKKKILKTCQMTVQGLSLSTDGKLLAVTEPSVDHSVLFLNAKTLTPVHRIKNVGFAPSEVHFADNDRKLVVQATSTLEIIDLAEVWRLLHKL